MVAQNWISSSSFNTCFYGSCPVVYWKNGDCQVSDELFLPPALPSFWDVYGIRVKSLWTFTRFISPRADSRCRLFVEKGFSNLFRNRKNWHRYYSQNMGGCTRTFSKRNHFWREPLELDIPFLSISFDAWESWKIIKLLCSYFIKFPGLRHGTCGDLTFWRCVFFGAC